MFLLPVRKSKAAGRRPPHEKSPGRSAGEQPGRGFCAGSQVPTGAVTVLSVEPQGQTSPAGTFLRTDADWAEAAMTVLGGGMGVGGTEKFPRVRPVWIAKSVCQ